MNAPAPMPLPTLAEHYGERGWQLVPTQWHVQCPGRAGQSPVRGVTGSAAFLGVEQVTARVRSLVLHQEGGPQCVGRHAKPAVRPPVTVVGFDVDHGYAGKSGGDTLVAAEMRLGPLPGTYSCTARGQYSPSRRLWLRIPPDLIVRDSFFAEFGGCIETVRTGHRFSWAPPAVHVKAGRVVGPVRWYDPAGEPCRMPHVDGLGELPAPWVRRGYELMAAEPQRSTIPVDPAGRTPITEHHANAVVAKLAARLHSLAPVGGEFRNALYGLTAAVARRASAYGRTREEARAEVLGVLAEHPARLTPDRNDHRWISEGITAGYTQPWGLVPEPDELQAPATRVRYPDEATDADLDRLVTDCTGFTQPHRLGQRTAWVRQDAGEPGALVTHARAMIRDAIDGAYPGARAVTVITEAYRAAGGKNPDAPRRIFAVALGSIYREVTE